MAASGAEEGFDDLGRAQFTSAARMANQHYANEDDFLHAMA